MGVAICIHSGGVGGPAVLGPPSNISWGGSDCPFCEPLDLFSDLFPTRKISVSANERSAAGQSSLSTAQLSGTRTFHLSCCLKNSCVYHKTW